MSVLKLVVESYPEMLSLAEGIAILERGAPCPGINVDLGFGAIASATGPLGQSGLSQRLLGHRLLLALASDPAQEGLELPDRELEITQETRELLDLVTSDT